MLVSGGQSIEFSNAATVDLGVDGGVVPIEFLTCTADELGGAFVNSMV